MLEASFKILRIKPVEYLLLKEVENKSLLKFFSKINNLFANVSLSVEVAYSVWIWKNIGAEREE